VVSDLADKMREVVGAPHVEEGEGLAVRPGAALEAADVVRQARRARVPVQIGARGGGVALDLARLVEVLHIDETSLLVHVQAGIALAALEERLSAHGLTLGPLSPASLGRTLGAALAAPRPSEATPRGRLSDLCGAIDAVLGDGTLVHTRLAPRRATGPDLAHAVLGAAGRGGIIVGAWLRCYRKAPARRQAGWVVPSGEAAVAAGRELLARDARPADLALVDGALAGEVIGAGAVLPGEALLVARFDGVREVVDAELELASQLAGKAGGRPIAPPLAASWFAGRPARWGGERPVASGELAGAWAARGPRAELCGWLAEGAALVTDVPIEPAADPLDSLFAALHASLDPASVLGNGDGNANGNGNDARS
jgi:alkyldihydroxyacetonephosphate synthase